ncbi:MAG: 2-iminoacetate synthase ThiH [Bacteroidales bacterium]|nr:2-iminoacetate synthase ThiH [Bacteroidales bacterium]
MKNSFYNEIQKYPWESVTHSIYSKTAKDVEYALNNPNPGLEDFKALISPAAIPYLEQMMIQSQQITQKRFGKTIQMYIPMYISNYCNNTCVYCGFNHKNHIERTLLSLDEILKEAQEIKREGFEHILLVTGEDNKHCNSDYINNIMKALQKIFALISIEIQPLETNEYKKLITSGLNTVYIYQETYHEGNYETYHPSGKKKNYRYRLETPDRLGEAGVHKIGLGCLLGLEDWRTDSFFTALHLNYLEKHYWQTKYSISFPRLRPHAGAFQPNYNTTQKELLQLICAYRIFNEQVEISLSTREDPSYRDNMLKLGVTSFSAGSKTNPGAYSQEKDSLEQFSVNDNRNPQEIAEVIKTNGYEVVWKDWDYYMQNN